MAHDMIAQKKTLIKKWRSSNVMYEGAPCSFQTGHEGPAKLSLVSPYTRNPESRNPTENRRWV